MFGPETGEQLTLFISERSYNLVSWLLLTWWIIILGKDVKIESRQFGAITSAVSFLPFYKGYMLYFILIKFIFHHPHACKFLGTRPLILGAEGDQILADAYFCHKNAPADIYRVDIVKYSIDTTDTVDSRY